MTEAPVLFLGGSPLNRLSWLRTSASFLNDAASHPATRWLVFSSGLQPLVRVLHAAQRTELATLPTGAVAPYLGARPYFGQGRNTGESYDGEAGHAVEAARLHGPHVVFLGVHEPEGAPPLLRGAKADSINGTPYFALDLEGVPAEETSALLAEGAEWSEPRSLLGALQPFDAALLAAARSMLDWAGQRKFCPACGSPAYSLWAGWKIGCSSLLPWAEKRDTPCPSGKGLHNYTHPRTDIVVITAVVDQSGDKILLGRNKRFPTAMYSTLAGFIEPGESLEDAVRREIWEEAGVHVRDVRYHAGQPWPFPANLMIGCYATADTDATIRTDIDDELADARWFTKAEVRTVLAHPRGTIIRRPEYKKFDELESGGDAAAKAEASVENAALAPNDEKPAPHAPAKPQGDHPPFRVPPLTAIAGVLISTWANAEKWPIDAAARL